MLDRAEKIVATMLHNRTEPAPELKIKGKVFVAGGEAKAAVPVIESLGKSGLEIHVGCQSRWCAGILSRYTRKVHRYVAPELAPEQFIDQIEGVLASEKFDALIPVGDLITALVSEHRGRLSQYTGIVVPEHDIFIKGRDKQITTRIAIENNIPCPATYFPDDCGIENLKGRIKYPVLIKPAVSHGARGIQLISSENELVEGYETAKKKYPGVFIQEYISQKGMQYKADVLIGKRGDVKAAIVYSKLRYYPIEGGSSILNQTVHRPDIISYAVSLLKAMNWYGFADFDFIEDPEDGIPKLLEINPRFPESFRITLSAGLDFPMMIYQMAIGQDVPQRNGYKLDVYSRFLPGDLLWFIKSPDRLRTNPSFFKFFGKNMHYYLLNTRDPLLIAGFILENLSWKRLKSRIFRS